MQRNIPCKQYQPYVLPDVAINEPMKRLFEDIVNIWHRHDTLVEDRAPDDDGRFEAAQQQIFADAAARIDAYGDPLTERETQRTAQPSGQARWKCTLHNQASTVPALIAAVPSQIEMSLADTQAAAKREEAALQQKQIEREEATAIGLFIPPLDRAPPRPHREIRQAPQNPT